MDLYWILKKISLADLVPLCQKKYKDLDFNLVLKSLVYFDDVIEEPIIYKYSGEVDFEEIKLFLRKTVDSFLN